MADRLYLSLWYPNFRLEALPDALLGVLRQFAQVGSKRVFAASAYPINFTESPTYQRIYAGDDRATQIDPFAPIDPTAESDDLLLEAAVAEATEQLHDDMAYEFEMRWQLWIPEGQQSAYNGLGFVSSRETDEEDSEPDDSTLDHPDSSWRMRSHTVRILGFGPLFDVAGYEQNGQLLVDFGIDTPWIPDHPLSSASPQTPEEEEIGETAQIRIQQNVEKLLAFTLLVEKNCSISSRLLWTESGKPLAEKLIASLQRVH
ncbi:MAG: hypothetical protein ACLQM6_02915 [Acidobacteriaceae bacterium]